MDKETLSNYGWIVICVLVLAVMIALATPFGTFVADAVKSTTQGLFDVNQNALNSTGLINIDGQEFESCAHEYEMTGTTANCTTAGTTTYTCKLCGKTYSEETPAGHKWDDTGLTCTKCNTKFGEYVFVASDYDAKMGTTTATDAVVVIPETFECYGSKFKVTGIGKESFKNCTNLTSITLPNTITVIANQAFYGCKNLSTITLPNSVTTIEVNAFIGCGFEEIIIPDSVTVLGGSAFNGCKSLVSVKLSQNLTVIGTHAFAGCTALTNITIPANITTLESYVFDGCTALTSITFTEGSQLKYIGERCFSTWSGTACINLENITFGGTMEQWNAISFGGSWNRNVPATVVHCSDGDVTL